jgi:hypothetical protein
VFRVFVDLPLALLHGDVVEIGRERRESQISRLQILAELYDLVPGLPGKRHRVFSSPREIV